MPSNKRVVASVSLILAVATVVTWYEFRRRADVSRRQQQDELVVGEYAQTSIVLPLESEQKALQTVPRGFRYRTG